MSAGPPNAPSAPNGYGERRFPSDRDWGRGRPRGSRPPYDRDDRPPYDRDERPRRDARDYHSEYRDRDRDRDRGDRGYGRPPFRPDERERRNDRDRSDNFRGSRRPHGGLEDRPARHRSRSPAPPREPSPTLDSSNIVPINERKRRQRLWDIKPQGYEHVTADQAKLSGLFPLPGAPRQTDIDPSKISAFMAQPGIATPLMTLKPVSSRQARRLVVHDLPESVSATDLSHFINEMTQSKKLGPRLLGPIVWSRQSKTKKWIMLEFQNAEDATAVLALDGTSMNDIPLKLRRPKDYITPHEEEASSDGTLAIAMDVPDSPYKIMVSRVPEHLTREQAEELFSTFGEIKSFVMMTNRLTDDFNGVLFLEYKDKAVTQVACEGLNNLDLGGQEIRVQRACVGITQVEGDEKGTDALIAFAENSDEKAASRVLQLLNLVSIEEVQDMESYQEVLEDMQSECSKFGNVVDIKIPKPGPNKSMYGVGRVGNDI